MSKLTEISTKDFTQVVIQAPTPVLVDFYAPWCGPCRMVAPLLEALAETYAGQIQFVKVNVDDAPEVAARYHITGVPTLMAFHNGKVIKTIVGLASPRALTAALDPLASLGAAPVALEPACCR